MNEPDKGKRSKGTRRRGDLLENAILQAAWEEWRETGYTALTMEAIAIRAGTNKNALYRRWPNKTKLVLAAIIKLIPKPSLDVPDTGDLREDVLILLNRIAETMQLIGAETIHGIMADYYDKDIIAYLPQMIGNKSEDQLTMLIRAILENAEKRGEVALDRLHERVVSLPGDLLRYELFTTHEPLSKQTMIEIVDDIFLPLVRI